MAGILFSQRIEDSKQALALRQASEESACSEKSARCVTTNATAKPVTFLHETNHGCAVVSHMCSCKALTVSKQ